ncbi:MAG: GNAT family N-acetyltransferase [Spirochaetales bacterium]
MNLVAPEKNRHLETVAQMFAMTFSDYWDRRRYVHDGYVVEAGYDWDASRIAVVDGEVATHFGVWDRTMRIAGANVRVAAIGAVATLEHHRKKGLMAETAAACVNGLYQAGYDMAMLFGIPNFYHRFDFVRSFAEGSFHLATRDLPSHEQTPSFEEAEYSVSDLSTLYNEENATVTGTFVRPTYRLNRKPKVYTTYRHEGGYVVVRRNEAVLQMVDCAGEPETILAVLKAVATKELCPEIELTFLPRKSRLGEHVQKLAHSYTSEQQANGGPMFRMVNLSRTVERLLPVFSERLARSGLAGYSGALELRGKNEVATVSIANGRAQSAVMESEGSATIAPSATVDGGAYLVRLLVGDDAPERVCAQTGITLAGDASKLVPVLFPHEEPQTILWDRF